MANTTSTTTKETTVIKGGNYQPAELPSYEAQTDKVNQAYDAARDSSLSSLKRSFDQSLIDTEAQAAKIPETYREAANQSAANYDRLRQEYNESAAASGISTGAGSQARLAMMNQQQNDQTNINKARAQAVTDTETQILKLKTDYQNAIAEASANNDYERAAALLDEYQRQAQSVVSTAQAQADENYRASSMNYQQMMTRAETLASFGDFSGYSDLGYSAEEIANMRRAWIAANPSLARSMGYTDGGGGGYYSYDSQSGSMTAADEIAALREAGYTDLQIDKIIQQAVASGAKTPEQAAQLNDILNFDATKKTYASDMTAESQRNQQLSSR